jgi:glutamine synthetase
MLARADVRLKRAEWREYHAHVGSWEIERYLTAL